MKRVLFTIIFAILAFGALAQESKQLININQASFRPVQTDALTGVNIDKIAKDRSQRECARIKIHVNRMTREEIDQLQVVVAGGNVALTRKITAYEGNGLIVEMTAKPQVRFHLHHDKYGDSNQVTVDLEGNKEYFLDAQLDLLLPIVVATNVSGADIYIDGAYRGRSNANYMLTVEDVTPGPHKITVKHGAASVERTVEVNSSNISFRVEVNTQTSHPQYVVFKVNPVYAVVMVDGAPLETRDGSATTLLQNGTYTYRVMARGYHEKSGTFTVSGEKVQIPIDLKADAATVTITSGAGAEIWVNNELKGTSPWKGVLLSGTYIFEARKAGHRTMTLSQIITSNPAEQSYRLDAPTPIEGVLNLTSEPSMADVYLNGKNVGQTPLMTTLLVGDYNVELRRQGYMSQSKTLTIAEGKTSTHNISLTKLSAPSSSKSSSDSKNVETSVDGELTTTHGPYKVGDLFHENGRKGVVFEVATDGMSGKIVTLKQHSQYFAYARQNEALNWRSATNMDDGEVNFAKIKKRSNWKNNYPAFAWCAGLGEGWYLPANNELKSLLSDEAKIDSINKTIKANKGNEIVTSVEYWSSTEYYKRTSHGHFLARYIKLTSSYKVEQRTAEKFHTARVLAVAKFTADPAAKFVVEYQNYMKSRRRIEYTNYFSTNKAKMKGDFGAKVKSHTIKDYKGVIEFETEPTIIPSRAFYDDDYLVRITIPAGVTKIGAEAFKYCNRLESVIIPEGVTSIGEGAFESCRSLLSVRIPEGVTSIANKLFDGCTKLKNVYLPDSALSIGADTFAFCPSLESITMPSHARAWDLKTLLRYCESLKEFKGPHATADGRGLAYNGIFYKVVHAGDPHYAVPEGITKIGDKAFSGQGYLTSITIPNSVTSIGVRAFSYCGIENFTIPEIVSEIGNDAFWGCESLKNVYCKNPIPPIGGEDMFGYYKGRSRKVGCTIYVPAQSVKAYKKAPYWKNYKKYIKPMTE